jgi:hypothetical protein
MKRYSIPLRRALGPWLFALLYLAPPAVARDGSVRLVTSAASAISFQIAVPSATIVPAEGGTVRVVIDGYGTFSPPGAVELPGRAFRVAVPQAGEVRVSAAVLEEERIGPLNLARVPGERFVEGENGIAVTEQFYPPDPWANGGGPPLVEAGAASFMGRQRVLAVRVNPLIVDAAGARLVRRLTVTVSFAGQGVAGAGEGVSAEPVSSTWKRLYDELLVNPGDVPNLRKQLVRAPMAASPGEFGKRLKLRVPETGLYSMRADSLIAAGLSTGLSTGELALEKYYYDAAEPTLVRKAGVPLLVVESSSTAPGIFDGEDRVFFYALGIKDDAQALDADALYTNDNVLWLEEEVAGDLMDQAPSPPSTALIALDRFTATMRYRKDVWYMKNAVPHTFDFYYAKAPDVMSSSASFTIRHPDPDGEFSLSLRLQGNDPSGYSHPVSFSVRNSGGTTPIGSGTFWGKEARTFSFSGLSASMLVDGQNELVIVSDEDYKHLINDFTIQYRSLFVASGNSLEFAVDPVNPLNGPVAIEIAGFTVNGGYLIDITDPQNPSYRTLAPADFVADGGGYKLALKFEGDLAPRRFIALGSGAGQALPVRAVTVDTPSHLREEIGPFDALVISHKNFLQRMGDYASWRAGQGYRLLTADVEDVFDEFNGGLPNATAIKRFIKYGFDHWGVEYVLLVGDGNEDHKRVKVGLNPEVQGSPPDFVPPFTYSTNVSGTIDDEVVYSDNWYAFLDENVPVTAAEAAPERDLFAYGYPDVIVGRLPVGRDVELRAILNKTTRMEASQPGDSWRRRVVLFSDDRWSGRGAAYRYNSYERTFEDSTESCGKAIERALPGGFDVQRLYQRQYTDPIHPNNTESGPAVLSKATTQTRSAFTPALTRALNRGCLWYMFQGHANRTVLTTEVAYSLGWYMDVDSLRTYTPFIFVGFGCHISDFAIRGELDLKPEAGPNGDCMSEQLLFKPGAGAVATYASVGFEYLSTNADLSSRFHRTFFQSPPVDSVGPRNEYTGAHWILGEVVTKAAIEQIDQGDLDMVLRYTILGDPMLKIDPGPPLMRFEADWGDGFREVSPDTIRAHNGTNLIKLRLTVSDIVAIGRITLQVNGEDWTDSLAITPLVDSDKTYARAYRADIDYTIDPSDELLAFKVFTPDAREAGVVEIPLATRLRLFFNDYSYEIGPAVESPPSGLFILTLDSPAYFLEAPRLSIDGVPQDDVHFGVSDQRDSLHLEASFHRTLASGLHVFTVKSGDFSRDFTFAVTGTGLVVDAFSFPNPFSRETNIVYSLNLAAEDVTIDIYTVSGLLIRTLEMPADKLAPASLARPHSVLWDGRDLAGDRVGNGTYIYVVHVRRSGETADIKGTSVKLE